jgi:N-carbamoylputrescine amidase
MVKVGLVQCSVDADRGKNLEKIVRLTEESIANGAQIICHHELATSPYFCIEQDIRHFAAAESIPGHTTELMGQIAKKSGVVIIVCLFEKAMEGEFYNTAVVLGTDGKVIGKYRKTHIPLIESSDGENVYEKFYFRPGNLGFPVFNTPFGVKFGIITCYDRHFAETGRMVALGGAEVLFVPSATAGVTTKFWEVELQFHAITNVMYVCGVNRVGKDTGISTSREHMGGTLAVNYRGEIMAQAGNERDEIVYGELDLEQLREFRSYCGYYRDRRPSIYAAICRE